MKPSIDYIPAGYDPTTEEYQPKGPTCASIMVWLLVLFLAGGLAFVGLSGATKRTNATPTPTNTTAAPTITARVRASATLPPPPSRKTEPGAPTVKASATLPPPPARPTLTATATASGAAPITATTAASKTASPMATKKTKASATPRKPKTSSGGRSAGAPENTSQPQAPANQPAQAPAPTRYATYWLPPVKASPRPTATATAYQEALQPIYPAWATGTEVQQLPTDSPRQGTIPR